MISSIHNGINSVLVVLCILAVSCRGQKTYLRPSLPNDARGADLTTLSNSTASPDPELKVLTTALPPSASSAAQQTGLSPTGSGATGAVTTSAIVPVTGASNDTTGTTTEIAATTTATTPNSSVGTAAIPPMIESSTTVATVSAPSAGAAPTPNTTTIMGTPAATAATLPTSVATSTTESVSAMNGTVLPGGTVPTMMPTTNGTATGTNATTNVTMVPTTNGAATGTNATTNATMVPSINGTVTGINVTTNATMVPSINGTTIDTNATTSNTTVPSTNGTTTLPTNTSNPDVPVSQPTSVQRQQPFLHRKVDIEDVTNSSLVTLFPVSGDIPAYFGNLVVNSWFEFEWNVPVAGFYDVYAGIASPEGAGSFDLVDMNTTLPYETFTGFPITGAWDVFASFSRQIEVLTPGLITMRVAIVTEAFNLQWMYFTPSVLRDAIDERDNDMN